MDIDAALDEIREFLPCATPLAWFDAAVANQTDLLVDHANCEKKAAATAMNLMYRHIESPRLLVTMARLAREELLHFQQVVELMTARGIAYSYLGPSRYMASLREQALALIDHDVMREALASLLSEPRQPAGLDFEVDCGHIAAASTDTVLVRHGAARLLIDSQGNAWLNGERRALSDAERPLACLLARQRKYTEMELQPLLNDESEQLMEEWIDAGFFTVIE